MTGCPAPFVSPFKGPIGAGPLIAPPAMCTSCDCGAPTGVSCGTPTLSLYGGTTIAACDNGVTPCSSQMLASTCAPVDTGSCAGTLLASVSSVPAGGVCDVNIAMSKLAPSWTTNAFICADPSAPPLCSHGACAPAPPTDAGPMPLTCIYAMGPTSCPPSPSPYSTPFTIFTGIQDTRGCGGCSCGPSTGSTCSGALGFSMDPAQCTAPGTVTFPLTCGQSPVIIGNPTNVAIIKGPTASGGSCRGSGVPTAMGAALAQNPILVCCM